MFDLHFLHVKYLIYPLVKFKNPIAKNTRARVKSEFSAFRADASQTM